MDIIGNSVVNKDGTGGGLCAEGSNTEVEHCKIMKNRAAKGGAIYISYGDIKLNNSLLCKNSAIQYGAVLFVDHSNPILENVTVLSNKSSTAGVLYITRMSRVNVHNSIFWNNSPKEIYKDFTSRYNINYSDMDTTIDGTGNICTNPQFIDMSAGNYKLSASSPCKDNGDPQDKFKDYNGSRNDMGAYGGKKGNW